MKLELKHLSGYFPYKLQVFHTDTEDNSERVTELLYMANDCLGFDDGCDYYLEPESMDEYNPIIKPILRPMSDLYNAIDGKVPLVEIGEMYGLPELEKEDYDSRISYGWNVLIQDDYQGYEFAWDNDSFGIWYDDIEQGVLKEKIYFKIEVMEYLFKNHFDIYGLIEQGLAVSKDDVPF